MKGWIRSPWQLLPLVAVLALLLAVGCGGGGQSGGGQGGGSEGNNLVIGYDQEPAILNNFITGGDLQATADMISGILESPLQVQPDFTYAPELAESDPEILSENPLVIQYMLKEGLTWSDGEPLTSDDALFTYEQIMNEDNQILTREGWDQIESFETPDERTVRITFSEPYGPWRDLLASPSSLGWILPRHVYEGQDFNTALNDDIVGSGPFQLREWNKGENLVLERNPNYWGESPALDSVTIRFIPDTNSLVSALQSNEISFIAPPPDVGLLERLQEIEGTGVESEAGVVWEHIGFNTELVTDPRIRQAIAYGIDRRQIVDEILEGQVGPLQSVIVPDLDTYYVPAWEDYTPDPARAQQLVEEAAADGADTTITYSTTSGNRLRETLQEIVQQQLGDLGITIEIDNSAAEEFFGTRLPEGDFEMGEWAWVQTPEPQVTDLFSENQLPPAGKNYYRYENEEATQALESANTTVDVEERAELLRRAQEQMAQDLPLIPLYQRPVTYAFNENLSGPQVNPSEAGPFWNLARWSLEGR